MALATSTNRRPFTNALTAERARRIFELKRDNPKMGFRALGKAVGISGPSAHKLYHKVLDLMTTEMAEDARHVRTMELLRLDELYDQAHARIGRGVELRQGPDGEDIYFPDASDDLKAIRECLRISESRRRLTGTDAPEKHEHSGVVTIGVEVSSMPDEELDKELEGVTAHVPPHEGRRRRSRQRAAGAAKAAATKQPARVRGRVARPQEQEQEQPAAQPQRGQSPTG